MSTRLSRLLQQITWRHIVRAAGLAALTYEVVVDQVDRPSLMIVIGSMILGVEMFHRDRESNGASK